MSDTFTSDLSGVVTYVLSCSGEEGVTAEKAVELLEAEGYTVPGEGKTGKEAAIRGLFAWVNPSVGTSKRGPNGGFVRAEHAGTKSKKGQGVISHLNRLKEQGLSEDAIREALTNLARKQGATGTSA